MKLTLEFKDKIGQQITIKDQHRFYSGTFCGSTSDMNGIYLKVGNKRIKIGHETEMEFQQQK